jgi:hypothetical protein
LQIIPEAERALGGVHSANRGYAQEAIDGMVDAIVAALAPLHQRTGVT